MKGFEDEPDAGNIQKREVVLTFWARRPENKPTAERRGDPREQGPAGAGREGLCAERSFPPQVGRPGASCLCGEEIRF